MWFFFSRLYMAFEKHFRTYWKEQEMIIKLIMTVLHCACTVTGLISQFPSRCPSQTSAAELFLQGLLMKTSDTAWRCVLGGCQKQSLMILLSCHSSDSIYHQDNVLQVLLVVGYGRCLLRL